MNYQGNCINSFDEDGYCVVDLPFETTSDFACACENDCKLSNELFEKITKIKIQDFCKIQDATCSYYNGVFMLYDEEQDVHHFFKANIDDVLIQNNQSTQNDYKLFTEGCCAIYAHAMIDNHLADSVIGVYKKDGTFIHAYAKKDDIIFDILGSRKIENLIQDILIQFSDKIELIPDELIIKEIHEELNDNYNYDRACELLQNHNHSLKI